MLRLSDVFRDFLSALVNVLDHGVLFGYQLLHLVEHGGKLGDGLFDALDFVVPGLHFSESRPGLTTAVAGEQLDGTQISRATAGKRRTGLAFAYCLGKDLLALRVFARLSHLLFASIGLHNPVLSCHLFPGSVGKVLFYQLVFP